MLQLGGLAALAIVGLLSWLLFKDTMNRIQYVETLRIYWITRNTGTKGTPFVQKAFMRQTAEPYWRGSGVQFRVGKYTFQCGRLTFKVDSLAAQLGRGYTDESPKQLRNWGQGGR